jgi:lactaldehyde reductase
MSTRFILNEFSYFGRGSRSELVGEITKRGFKNVFVVTDAALVKCGVVNKVTALLDEANINYTVYSDVKPNPTIANVMNGLKECKEFKADLILTIGGGSAMDTAKGVSILMTNPDRTMESLCGLSNTANKGLPIIAMPTTAGTASEVTINYVITNEETQVKMVCVDPNDLPIVAIVDSELMETMPASLAAATGLDALTHAVEGYITKGANLMSDMFHLESIKLIFANLTNAVKGDKEAIEKAIQELKDVLDSNDSEKIKEKTDALMQTSMKMGEAMYKQQQEAAAGTEQQQTEQPKDETVVDADFEEVKK